MKKEEQRQEVKQLKKCGLPESLFAVDFNERLAASRALRADLLQRMAELDQDPEWRDKQFPWSTARDAYKERLAAGTEPDFVTDVRLVQSARPMWVDFMDDVEKKYRNGGLQATRELRRATESKKPPRPGTRRARIVADSGFDLDAARAAHRD